MGPADLAQVLRRLQSNLVPDPAVIVGLETPDDAGVYRIDERRALVSTTDFFTPVVDDPRDWGRIAVANALSDVYAMGAQPLFALNIVAWPKDLDASLLAEVLAGGSEKAREAGVAIVGGHTVDDAEPKYGLAVTGIVDVEKVVRMSGAQPGAALVLTKPLGSGIVSTAIKKGKAPAEIVAEMTRVMSTLNDVAAKAMVEAGCQAATDVTGFGLLGHLQRMVQASGVSATIKASATPVVEGVAGLATRGFVAGGTKRNEDYFGKWCSFRGVSEQLLTILFDAQTSGGLLIAIAEENLPHLLELVQDAQFPAVKIGTVHEGEAGNITVK